MKIMLFLPQQTLRTQQNNESKQHASTHQHINTVTNTSTHQHVINTSTIWGILIFSWVGKCVYAFGGGSGAFWAEDCFAFILAQTFQETSKFHVCQIPAKFNWNLCLG
jgi:hypothetical protein